MLGTIHVNLLIQWRHIPMGQFHANIFLIQTTSNYLWASEVFKNQSFKSQLFSSSQKKIIKVGFFQKVMAKFSNLSKCHSCEPKIVPELLFPVNIINKILVNFWIDLVIKSPHYEIWLKNANYMGEFNCLQCLQSSEIIDYTHNTYLNQL